MITIDVQEELDNIFSTLELFLEDNIDTVDQKYNDILNLIQNRLDHLQVQFKDLLRRKDDPHYNHTMLTLKQIFPDLTLEQIQNHELHRRGIFNNDCLRNTGTET